MKKVTRIVGIFVLCGFLGINSPVVAQNPDNTTATTDMRDDVDNDDSGKWGLAGLLGLLGLLGLRKKDDNDRVRTTTVNR